MTILNHYWTSIKVVSFNTCKVLLKLLVKTLFLFVCDRLDLTLQVLDYFGKHVTYMCISWWCHQMETFYALLALWEGNPSVTGGFPSQRPVTRSFDVSFDVHLNKRLSKQSRCWWFETPWRHCNDNLSTLRSYMSLKYSFLEEKDPFISHVQYQHIEVETTWPPLWQTTFSNAISSMTIF